MSHEKIESALTMLIDGIGDLQEHVEQEILGRVLEDDDKGPPPSEEQLDKMDEKFFAAIESSIGGLLEKGACEPADLLATLSVIAEALEERAPELFEEEGEEETAS